MTPSEKACEIVDSWLKNDVNDVIGLKIDITQALLAYEARIEKLRTVIEEFCEILDAFPMKNSSNT